MTQRKLDLGAAMKNLSHLVDHKIRVLFSDIDDTITTNGKLRPEAYRAIWDLHDHGISVVPVTGRPAGWCEMIARFWPVAGVIGENGGFYFRYSAETKKMKRFFCLDEKTRSAHKKALETIKDEILKEIPDSSVASDQFTRVCDLAIDFCEDIPPLSNQTIKKIVSIFEKNGAIAKVSSIHVNGWFGGYDKLSTCQEFCRNELGWNLSDRLNETAFVGDSPNDEPMFSFFKHSFAVANIRNFTNDLKYQPHYVTNAEGGEGFAELANRLLVTKQS
jgi:HAD superfamily hydrolase (TIGR01484 family)